MSIFKRDRAAPASAADPQVPALMRDLAERILPVYADDDQLRYLGNLSMLQLTAGAYEAAQDTRQTLQKRRGAANATPPVDWSLLDVYAQAKAAVARNKADFGPAFGKLLQQTVSRLSDEEAYALTTWHGAAPETFGNELQAALDSARGTSVAASQFRITPSASTFSPLAASVAPVRSQSICQGTMLEWCSMWLMRISSPALTTLLP